MEPERFDELDAQRLGVLFAEFDSELAGRREPIEIPDQGHRISSEPATSTIG